MYTITGQQILKVLFQYVVQTKAKSEAMVHGVPPLPPVSSNVYLWLWWQLTTGSGFKSALFNDTREHTELLIIDVNIQLVGFFYSSLKMKSTTHFPMYFPTDRT